MTIFKTPKTPKNQLPNCPFLQEKCEEHKCAWWHDEYKCCSLVSLSRSLARIRERLWAGIYTKEVDKLCL